MLRQELVRTVASRQMQMVGLPYNVTRVRRVAREVCLLPALRLTLRNACPILLQLKSISCNGCGRLH